MIGPNHAFAGIGVRYTYAGTNSYAQETYGWSAELDYFDKGFNNDDVTSGAISTEGTLRTRYAVRDLDGFSGLLAVINAVLTDAKRFGIEESRSEGLKPSIWVSSHEDDNADLPEIPNEDIEILRDIARELDFELIGSIK